MDLARAVVEGDHLHREVGRPREVLLGATDRLGALAGDEGGVGGQDRVGAGGQQEAALAEDRAQAA